MNKNYFVPHYPKIYKKSTDKLLSEEIEKLGFEYSPPELGGGGGAIINHILAYLSIDTNRDAIITGLLTNIVWEAVKKVFNWHKQNCLDLKKANPSVNIYIYTENKSKNYFVNIPTSEEKTKQEIEEILKSTIESESSE